MKDLKIDYDVEGKRIHKEYDCIFDMTDAIENKEAFAPPLTATNVEALFFENELQRQRFVTIEDLVNHCRKIMRG